MSGLRTLYTWNILSPRLGLTAKLSADGRTMLRASYGRFSQGVLTGELGAFHPAVTPVITSDFVPADAGYTRIRTIVDRTNLQLDPETRAPRTDEYSIGLDREIGRRTALAIAYVRKDGANSSDGPTWAVSIGRTRGCSPTETASRCSCSPT